MPHTVVAPPAAIPTCGEKGPPVPTTVDGAIEVLGLVKRFAAREVLSGMSLSVACGEVAAIMGPSGGGKSTLLRCLAGLEAFDAGTIDIAGIRLTVECIRRFERSRREMAGPKSVSRPIASGVLATMRLTRAGSVSFSNSSICSRTGPCWET